MKYFCVFLCILVSTPMKAFQPKDWWETGNFYQIYPRSFKDSNGDGIGDLQGVISKLGYLKELGISAAWLSPIFKSPMVDFGYDTGDYYLVQDEYGTVADLEELVQEAGKLGIKIILDFVPNHTSDENEWFIKSAQRDPHYENYYVWHPGKINNETGEREPPSNWIGTFRYSAWTWNEQRQEYYLHQFAVKQPDLNYREPKVVEQMKDVLLYWLNKGIGGVRIDAVPYLFEVQNEDGSYPDEPLSGACDDPEGYCYLNHIYTQDQPETYDMVYQWRTVLDEFSKQKGDYTRIMLTEAYTSLDHIIEFFGDEQRNGSHIPFNFELISYLKKTDSAKQFKEQIDAWLEKVPPHQVSNWVLGNHDNKRTASRMGIKRADLMNILLQTLPGVAVTYNGEEIGMTDVYIPWSETVDPSACNTNPDIFDSVSRDPARTPFQWDDTQNAGFGSSSTTWLPLAPDYKTNNVKLQKEAVKSHLKIFEKLVQLRKQDILQYGDYEAELYNDDVLIYKRQVDDEFLLMVLNFGDTDYEIDLQSVFDDIPIPAQMEIILSSVQSQYNDGDIVDTSDFAAQNNVGYVLSTISS